MITLRPYQARATTELLEWFRANDGHPIMDAAVGSGKSVMLAWLCQHAINTYPGTRIIMLVPTKELLEQNLGKLLDIWPDAPVGIMSASVGRKELHQPITIATIGSLYKHAAKIGHVDLMIVDECHLIPGGDMGMYCAFIADMHRYCPDMRVIGATGSPFRGNGIWLTAVEDAIFTDIACRITMDELLAAGYLSPLTTSPTVAKLDASGVRMVGGDYVVSELAKAIDRPELVRNAVAETIKLAADRSKWLIYCVTVKHAEHVCEELAAHGVAVEIVTGETPKADRAARIERFRAGQLRALVSVAVLTTGFDVPDVDCIVLLRNTQSPVLYVQIMGRGMRVADGKNDCLVLDFTDTVERLGPVNKIKGRAPRKTKGEAPVKVCDECGALNPISAKECHLCGTEFFIEEVDPHRAHASTALILDVGKPRIETYEGIAVRYAPHQKLGKPDSLRVEYWQGVRRVATEWVCLDHDGYAHDKAAAWWRMRRPEGSTIIPSVAQALDWIDTGYQLKEPSAIRVNESLKYPEIIGYLWSNSNEQNGIRGQDLCSPARVAMA